MCIRDSDPADAGMATGTVNTMRQIGTAAGVAALGALVQSRAEHSAAGQLDRLGPAVPREQLITEVGAGLGRHTGQYLPAGLRETVASIAAEATTSAVSTVFALAGVAALLAAAACGFLLTRRLPAETGVRSSISGN